MAKTITRTTEQDIVNYYTLNPTTIEVTANKFSLSSPTIIKILNKYNIERYKKAQIFNPNMNEDYFENIDTQNKAYFLGLIIADGNVFKEDNNKSNRQSSISITLQDSDNYILSKFKEEIFVNTSVASDGRGASTISVRSNKMADDLLKYNIMERKSFSTSLPNIDDNLMKHLIRGILDGDGSVQGRQTDIKNRYKHSVGFCGAKLLMTQIRDYLVGKLNLTNVSVYTYKNRELSMVTWSAVKDMKLLYHYLYDDAETYLIRKKEKFDSIMNHYNMK